MSDYDPNHVFEPVYFLIGVKIVLINHHKSVLLLRRSDKVTRSGGWDLPGGGVDKGEDPKDAASRELREEVDVISHSFVPVDTFYTQEEEGDLVTIGFAGIIPNNSIITLSWEHDMYEWVTLEELDDYDVPELYRGLIKKALSLVKTS